MSERLTADQFNHRLSTLQLGDYAMHGMLFPGVYPGDESFHELGLRGEHPQATFPFFQAVGKLVREGVSFKRLRVLPQPGQFGYDDADIEAMRSNCEWYAAACGEDVRVVDFAASALRLQARIGGTALADRYLASAYLQNPQAGFWHLRSHAAEQPTSQITIMDYIAGRFDGHQLQSPISRPVQDYVNFWEDIYVNYAEPVYP